MEPNLKNLKVHYGGFWNRKMLVNLSCKNYKEGMFHIFEKVDIDYLCMMDFMDDIKKAFSIPTDSKLSIHWLYNGFPMLLEDDSQILGMWKNITIENDYYYHLYAKSLQQSSQDSQPFKPPRRTLNNAPPQGYLNLLFGINPSLESDEFERVDPITVEDDAEPSGSRRQIDTQIRSSFLPEEDFDELPKAEIPTFDEDIGDAELTEDIYAEEGYHSSHSSEDEEGFGEFEEFVKESECVFMEEDTENSFANVNNSMEIQVGMEWPTIDECREYLRTYAVVKKFSYRQIKNESYRIRYACKDPDCKWMVYVRRSTDGHTMQVKGHIEEHICKCDVEGKNAMANAKWVADRAEASIRNHIDFKPKDIQSEIWERFGLKVSYWTAWNAKIMCSERIHGSYDESYSLAPELCRQILLKNPGSIAICRRADDDERFSCLCVAFTSSLRGFTNGCRPILGLDGCFLKGKYGGVCLSITSLDGNNGLFPIAIFICRSECFNTWFTFLQILEPYLKKHPLPLTFISDRQKGLVEAVNQVFPQSYHRFCFRHMYKNFKKVHKGAHLELLCWRAAKAYKVSDFERTMEELGKIEPMAKSWLEREPFSTWARSHFDTTTKCEHITSNFSESLNKWILTLRDKPISKFVEKLHLMIMRLIHDRRCKAATWDADGLVPRAQQTLEKLKKIYNKYTVEGATNHLHCAINKHGDRWTVDLNSMSCTCCEWQISGIPCVHAVAVIHPRRESWSKYFSPYHAVRAYMNTYAGYIHALADSKDWEKPKYVVLPPPLLRPPGRPALKRRRDEDEADPAKRQQKRCGKCDLYGHNNRTCKGAPTTQRRPMERGRSSQEGQRRGQSHTTHSLAKRSGLNLPPKAVGRGMSIGRGRTFNPKNLLGHSQELTSTQSSTTTGGIQ